MKTRATLLISELLVFTFIVSALMPNSVRAQGTLTPTPEAGASVADPSGTEMVYVPSGNSIWVFQEMIF